MRVRAAHRGFTARVLALGLILADMPVALAQEAAPAPATPVAQVEGPASPGTLQLATEEPRRPRRPPVDPATRELRQTRGIFAGGIVLTAVCGAGFGLFTYAVVDSGRRLQGQSGGRAIAAGGALLACTLASIAAIGVGAKRLRTLKSRGRVAWAGGLGLRF